MSTVGIPSPRRTETATRSLGTVALWLRAAPQGPWPRQIAEPKPSRSGRSYRSSTTAKP